MIYLFNDVKELTGTVRNNHILNLLYEREKNGIYSVSAEIPVTYNDQGTIYNYNKKIQKSDFLGHYDKEGRFQLHKIAAVDIENGSIFIKGIHIFFDEAKAGAIIQDRRFINREIIDGARVAFESIGWSVTDFDVSVGKTYNFYNVTPLEARQILVETFGFEFDYWLDFDGKKVTNRHVAVKEKIGEKTNKRYTYGHNVLNIRAEQDYSEIYTAVIGRGKGEEIEETGGYGRRIEYTDVVWTTPNNPLNKPAGTRVLEDPNATQLFGYKENGVVKPRIKVEVFSDIESPTELIQASYEWLMNNNVPKAVFSLKVADGDGLNLGDEVYVIYRDIDLVKSARVEKVTDDLVSGNRDVEFGDTAYFDTDQRIRGLRSDLKRYSGETGDRIYQLKMEYNRRFDEEVSSWFSEFEQNLIDQKALIEADRENMTNLIEGTRTEWTESFNASVAEAHRLREENYNAMSDHVNTTVDTTRTELGNAINASIDEAKLYAEQQAQAKAEEVRTDLETVTSEHQGMLDNLQDNVMSIDDFLGDKTVGLNELIYNVRQDLENRLDNIDFWNYNIIRGTSFDEPEFIHRLNGGAIETGDKNFYHYRSVENILIPYVEFGQEIAFESGRKYRFSFDYQTTGARPINYAYLIPTENDEVGVSINLISIGEGNFGTVYFGSEFRRYYIEFTAPRNMLARIRFGMDFRTSEFGQRNFRFRLPYLTETENTRWLYHTLDSTQNIEEVVRRVTELEDGREEFITKTQYDFETGEIEGSIKNIIETVDESTLIMQNHENWILTNGASIERTVDGFDSKAWLSDIHNPNTMSFSDVTKAGSRNMWSSSGTISYLSSEGFIRMFGSPNNSLSLISPNVNLIEGETYTLTFESLIGASYNLNELNQTFVVYPTATNQRLNGNFAKRKIGSAFSVDIYKYTVSFVASETTSAAKIYFGASPITPGQRMDIFIRKPKVELGSRSTPYENAFSNLTQRADEMMLAVQGVDGEGYLTQSDITLRSDYVQIGSQRLDGSDVGSLLRVSPTGIDMVAEAMRLSGDLYVDGDITALAVDAIEGNFAKLFTDQLTATTITGDLIASRTITSENIHVDHALVNRIIAQSVYADDVTAKIGNFIDLNAGNIVTAGLSANVITADHIQVGTQLVDEIFATSARIDELITKTHFVNEMHALTLNVVDLNASEIRARLLTANTIEAEWLKGGTALIDRLFATTAMFERMMSKTAFVTTLNAVTLDLSQLTIWRPDGVAYMQDGLVRHGFDLVVKPFYSGLVEFTGQNYQTTQSSYQPFERIYLNHTAKYLKLQMVWRLSGSSPLNGEYMIINIKSDTAFTDFTSLTIRKLVRRGESVFDEVVIDLGKPSYRTGSITLELRRDHSNGTGNSNNQVQARTGRVWLHDWS